MREIKFRAWDTKSNTMCEVVFAEWKDGKLDSDMEWMQYTGLKDKNGKNIYEGDILKGKHWENGVQISLTGEVKYLPAYFFIEDNSFRPQPNSNFEVIGNIYENPELLKEASRT